MQISPPLRPPPPIFTPSNTAHFPQPNFTTFSSHSKTTMKGNKKSVDHHVAVLAFPFASHPVHILSLIRRLAAAAPNVKFSLFNTERSNGSIFSGSNSNGFDNLKPYNVSDGVPEGHKMSGNPMEPIGFFLKAAPGSFKKAMEAAVNETGREIGCLITDAFFWFAAEMAEGMHISWVPLWLAGPCSISVHIYTDLLREKLGESGNTTGREDETIDFIPGCSSIRFRDLPGGVVSGDLKAPMSCMLHNMGRMLPRATAVAINSFEDMDPTITKDLKSKLKKFLNVGPFTLVSPPSCSDEHGCLTWLNKQKTATVAYICFGTVATPPPHELAALAEGLEESGVPFLWSFRGNPNDHLPKGFIERTSGKGKFVPWAPQLQVLEHGSTGVFVTHCGWNSIMESIAGGVPVICRPFFGDHSLNMRVAQNVWGIGVGFGNGVFTKSETVTSLNLVLSQDEGKKMREKLRGLKELATKAVGSNGRSVEDFKTLLEVVTMSK